jgi:hypothetical protein
VNKVTQEVKHHGWFLREILPFEHLAKLRYSIAGGNPTFYRTVDGVPSYVFEMEHRL